MNRKASIMFRDKTKIAEYKKRHDELWTEMKRIIKEHGAHNYSIFVNKGTGELFAYLELDQENRWDEIGKTEICKKWWKYMKPLMKTNPDNGPVSVDLEEV